MSIFRKLTLMWFAKTFDINKDFVLITHREKCSNTEFFLVCVFLYSLQIQENTDQRKLLIWKLFTRCVTYDSFNF